MFDLLHSLQYAGIAVSLATVFLLCTFKGMAALQQYGYRGEKAFRWYCRKDNMLFQRYCLLFLMLLLLSGFIGISTALFGVETAAILSLIPFIVFGLLFYFFDRKYALKVPLRGTDRVKRLAIVLFVLFVVVLYLLVGLCNVVAAMVKMPLVTVWKYVPLSFFPFLWFPLLLLANGLDSIYENAHNRKYVRLAQEKLKSDGKIRIGITGSYGKTSVKNILAAMLREKYAVLVTPASYNTPMGIARTVNENSEPYDVFISEMGARREGDIAELCALVEPDYSILTGVCAQHVESFGSVDAVLRTKSEIFSGTKGVTFVGADEYTGMLDCGEKISQENYRDVHCSADGTEFTFVYKGRELQLRTKLLGEHTAKNVALAAAMAIELGVTDEQIVRACASLDYIPHRLQVIRGENGVTVIDDSYNANVRSVESALAVLRLFPGKKTVVTPGIVELGILEEEENARLGGLLVGLDQVILVGDTLVGAVKNGYLAAGGDVDKICTEFTLDLAKERLARTLEAGDTVLFLNDLPDVY